MLDRFGERRLVVAGLVALLVLLLGGPAFAQQQLGNKEDVEYPFNKDSTLFNSLREGSVRYDAKAHKGLVLLAAKYYVYRVTWKTYQADKTEQGGLVSLRKRFGELMTAPATLSGKNRDFMKPLAHELIVCFKQVLDMPFESNHQAVTSAALMLQDFAKCRQEEVHDFLMELTKPDDKDNNKYAYSPFVRMCAIRGLGEFNNPNWAAIDDRENANLQQVKAKLNRDVARIDRLARFINYPYAPQGTSQELQDAYVFVRREGVKAMAQAQVPAYSAELKKEVLGAAAYFLVYVATVGKFANGTPPASLLEKTEAAIGLCGMKTSETPTYNPEFSVWAAATVLAQFTAEYNRDVLYFAKVVPSKEKLPAPRQEALSWQVYGARFEDALAALAANVKDSPRAAKNLEVLKNKLGPGTLATIKEHKKQIDTEVPPALSAFAASIRPMNLEIYPGTKDSPKWTGPQ
jgi:hypothetical protein